MAQIVEVRKEGQCALRFIGKYYSNDDRDEWGSYGAKWCEWHGNGWFAELEALGMANNVENGYLGFMSCGKDFSKFTYSIGAFFPADTTVPNGYDYIDLPEGDLAVALIKGKEQGDNIYGMHDECLKAFNENGMGDIKSDFINSNGEKVSYFIERYNCPRFTKPDDEGNVILDYCTYIN